MVNNGLVKCPLCGVFTSIDKPELLAALNDPKIRQQIEKYVAELLRPPSAELQVVATGQPQRRDFNKDVHNWNPTLPMWQRSPKE